MKTQNNIPKLRFPEFSDGWEVKKLGEITTWTSGGTPSKEVPHYWNGQIPWISASSMRGTQYFDSPTKITEEGLKSGSKLAQKGSLLILVRGSTLFNKIPIGLTMKDLSFNQDVKSISVLESTISIFILYWFISNESIILNMVTGTGIGAGKLDLPDLKSLNISLPPLPEQQKIATFLSTVDEKLQALKKKKSLLETYKKGIMQKLFSQNIRFKDDEGNDFEDWEVTRMREVYSFKVTNSFSRENLNYENGAVKNIHYGDIHVKFSTLFDIRKEIVPFINPNISIERIADENYCKEGDIIFADASEDLNDVGKSIEIVNLDNERLLSGLHTILARPFDLKLSIGFGGYLFSSENIRLQIQKEAQGSKVLSISTTRISNIQIFLPSLPEQTKIANFLTAIDAKINKVDTPIKQTEHWKKGLLQQMFV